MKLVQIGTPYLCALLVSWTILAGCDAGDRISQLEKRNADLKSQLDKNHTAVEYDLQSKCSRDAKAWFKEGWPSNKETTLLTYTNHYNKGTNQCLILIEYNYYFGGAEYSWMEDSTLWNVYENVMLAQFSQQHVAKAYGGGDNLVSCEVSDKTCTSRDQFSALVRPYLND